MKIEFTAYGVARPAGSKTGFVVKTKNGPRAVVADACKGTKPWQAIVSSAALEAQTSNLLLGGALTVSMRFYFPRPKSHYNSKGQLTPKAPAFITKAPDVLKLSRAVEDAMTGIIYRDDSQIVQEHLFKSYGEPARVEVCVQSLA